MVNSEKPKKIDMKKLDEKLRQLFDKNGNKVVEKTEDKKEKIITPNLEDRIIESVPVQSISPKSTTNVGGLDFNSPVLSGVSNGLESGLANVDIQKTETDSQQKRDETYQHAKMLYEDSESNFGANMGTRPMVAKNSNVLINEFSDIQPKSARMINSHPEIIRSMNENLIYDVQIKELRQQMPWENDTMENIVKKYKSPVNK